MTNSILCATIGISLTISISTYIYYVYTKKNSQVKNEIDPVSTNNVPIKIYKKVLRKKEMDSMIECCSSSHNLPKCTTNENTIYIDCDISMLSDPDYLTEIMTKIDRTVCLSPLYCTKVTTFEKIFEILTKKTYCAHYNFFAIMDEYCNILLYVGDNSYRQPYFVLNDNLDYINFCVNDSIINILDNYNLVTVIINRDINVKSSNKI